jgi:hypothetical protein
MAKVVVIGIPGEANLWQVDLSAGTVSTLKAPASGPLADALKLRSAGVTVLKGVNFAVAASSADAVAAGQTDG